jgi:hypothetical protein
MKEKIIYPLVIALSGTAGQRPMWRSAYILELTFGKDINVINRKFDSAILEKGNIKFVLGLISTTGVNDYLEHIQQQEEDERKTPASLVLEEIEEFSKIVDRYVREQSIKDIWLMK